MNGDTRTVAVIGGGLAGLAAAALVARAGQRAVVLERAGELGGRARTQEKGGFLLNQGAHALYAGGPAAALLRELGVRWTGKTPNPHGWALRGGRLQQLPATPWTLLTSDLLSWRGTAEVVKMQLAIGRIDPKTVMHLTVAEWLNDQLGDPVARALAEALVRVSTYTNAPQRQSAGAFIDQFQIYLKDGVRYIDGGWRTLVDGLRSAAERAGATIMAGSAAQAVERVGAGYQVLLGGGRAIQADAVIVAAGPDVAAALLGDISEEARSWRGRFTPARMACLDVCLRRLPNDDARFVLGLDRPLYLSAHSPYARLAPEGQAVIHGMVYLPEGEEPGEAQRRELEDLLDLAQPGWRDELVEARYLPSMVASNAVVSAAGGFLGRPKVAVQDLPGVFLAGDWVGDRGQLLDASMASARAAGTLAAEWAAASPLPLSTSRVERGTINVPTFVERG